MDVLTVTRRTTPCDAESLAAQVVLEADRLTAHGGGHTLRAASTADMANRLPMWLYAVLHAGREDLDQELPFHTQDAELDEQLARATAHQVVPRQFQVLHVGSEVVTILREGVKVAVPRAGLPSLSSGDLLALNVPSYRRRLSPGFFLSHGTRPADHARPVLRVYAHLPSPSPAVRAWGRATAFLEESGARYQVKVLSTPALYPRRDALVVYLDARDTGIVPDLAEVLTEHTRPGASAFTRTVAPGVSLAWEPADPRPHQQGQSFGQHRAAVLADALLNPPDELGARFTEANIDPGDVSRNLDSPVL